MWRFRMPACTCTLIYPLLIVTETQVKYVETMSNTVKCVQMTRATVFRHFRKARIYTRLWLVCFPASRKSRNILRAWITLSYTENYSVILQWFPVWSDCPKSFPTVQNHIIINYFGGKFIFANVNTVCPKKLHFEVKRNCRTFEFEWIKFIQNHP